MFFTVGGKKNFVRAVSRKPLVRTFLFWVDTYLTVMCFRFLKIRSKVKVKVTPHTKTLKNTFGHNSKSFEVRALRFGKRVLQSKVHFQLLL